MFSSECDECHAIRMDVARMTLEENSLQATLRYAKRLRNVVLLQSLFENLESLRKRRSDAQRAYRVHRKVHSTVKMGWQNWGKV
jgi:hypothetical protein